MSDLKKYIHERKKRDRSFAEGYDEGYEQFWIGAVCRMKKDYGPMNKEELGSALKDLRESLVDLEETMQFNLTYSSAHISGKQVSKDEESLKLLREEVARVEQLIAEK